MDHAVCAVEVWNVRIYYTTNFGLLEATTRSHCGQSFVTPLIELRLLGYLLCSMTGSLLAILLHDDSVVEVMPYHPINLPLILHNLLPLGFPIFLDTHVPSKGYRCIWYFSWYFCSHYFCDNFINVI